MSILIEIMYITQAFTLAKKNIGESDREYCFFTKKFGRIVVVARGIRKPNAKLQGQIELPCLTSIDFTSGNQKKLTGALIKNSFPKIRANLQASASVGNILQLIKDFVLYSETDISLWNDLKEAMDFLEKTTDKNRLSLLVEFFFTASLIKSLGFEPDLKEDTESKFIKNKQTLRSLKILFKSNLNKIMENDLTDPMLNQKENINKFLKHYLKYIKNSLLK